MDEAKTNWADYYDVIAGRSPRPLFVEAMAVAGEQPGRTALDLGFGDGTESRALLQRGWRVHAVDATPEAKERLLAAAAPEHRERLTVETADFATVSLPPADLVYAGLSLPFCHPDSFDRLWAGIVASLRPRGVLACHLFGVRDTWATSPDMSFVDADAARRLVTSLDVLAFRELEHDGTSYEGPKHWHVFEVVARQPAG